MDVLKKSEGCEHCYMYFLDKQRNQNGSNIYKVKNNFNYKICSILMFIKKNGAKIVKSVVQNLFAMVVHFVENVEIYNFFVVKF